MIPDISLCACRADGPAGHLHRYHHRLGDWRAYLRATAFTVTLTVLASCTISTTPMTFGRYTGVLLDATSTVTVTCTNATPYNVELDAGLATGATVTTPKMTGPSSALLSYALFRNSAHSLNWGVTVDADTVAGTGTGVVQRITVYGQIAAGQFVSPGDKNMCTPDTLGKQGQCRCT